LDSPIDNFILFFTKHLSSEKTRLHGVYLKSLRFGVQPQNLPIGEWIQAVQEIEKLDYSTVFRSDHFATMNNDPFVMLASAASVTKTLNIGSLVFAVDYRHPAIYAKAAATLHLLSSGRFEFGIGAGYDPNDYNMTGIPLDSGRVRVERLGEALKIIKGMWTQEKTSLSGKHYKVSEIVKAGELPEGQHPKILIAGGGRKILRLAAQYADIVGIIASWRGSWSNYRVQEMTSEGIMRKITFVKNAAKAFGRDPDCIEFQMMFPWTEITENPEPIIENIAKYIGVSTEDILASEYWSCFGSSSDIRHKIRQLQEETGMSYFVLFLRRDQFGEYAESIVKPLTR